MGVCGRALRVVAGTPRPALRSLEVDLLRLRNRACPSQATVPGTFRRPLTRHFKGVRPLDPSRQQFGRPQGVAPTRLRRKKSRARELRRLPVRARRRRNCLIRAVRARPAARPTPARKPHAKLVAQLHRDVVPTARDGHNAMLGILRKLFTNESPYKRRVDRHFRGGSAGTWPHRRGSANATIASPSRGRSVNVAVPSMSRPCVPPRVQSPIRPESVPAPRTRQVRR